MVNCTSLFSKIKKIYFYRKLVSELKKKNKNWKQLHQTSEQIKANNVKKKEKF